MWEQEYQSPYPLTDNQDEIPEGDFLLPVCTNRERFLKLISALNTYSALSQNPDKDHIIDVLEAVAFIDNPTESPCSACSDPEAQCISFYPQHPSFEINPGVVNGGTENPPAGYISHPFFSGDRYTVPGFALTSRDVLFDLLSSAALPGTGFIQQITEGGFPRIRFSWSGAATIELHLIGVPLGGLAIVRVDDGAEVDFIDLSSVTPSDLDFSLATILQLIEGIAEINFVPITVHEITINEPGEHYVDILFTPTVEISLNPIGWGGGLRKIVVCGLEVDCEQQKCDCEECGGCGGCDECEEC